MTIEVLPEDAPLVAVEERIEPAAMQYVGLATRAIAAAIDAAIVNGVVVIVGLGVSLIASLLFIPEWLKTVSLAVGAVAYVAWVVGYFAFFWSSSGQTPGDRIMMFRVVTPSGERLKLQRALLRCATTVLAALPLFLGFVLILFDSRRRALNDRLAGTVVIDAPSQSLAEVARGRGLASVRNAPPPADEPAAGGAEPNSPQSGDAGLPPVHDRYRRRGDHASLGS